MMKHIKEYEEVDNLIDDLDSLGLYHNYIAYIELELKIPDDVNIYAENVEYYPLTVRIRSGKEYKMGDKNNIEEFKKLAFNKALKGDFTQEGMEDLKLAFEHTIDDKLDDILTKDKRFFKTMSTYKNLDNFIDDMVSELDEMLLYNYENMERTTYKFMIQNAP